uniref:Uncharacterized protein n=1 Tax=Ananas comosus var. bracteatus TaxID=296719 RepID=A0A6V7NH69_ANACO|nr:unnamed protein product [Ananas comosus var. bracteatus]
MALANSLSSALCSKALLPTTIAQYSINYLPSLFFTSSSPSFHLSLPRCRRRTSAPAIPIIGAPKKLLPPTALQHQGEIIITTRRGEEEEMEELVAAIKGGLGLNSIGASDQGHLEALELVDLIERLGISRFFQEEIKEILKTTFM